MAKMMSDISTLIRNVLLIGNQRADPSTASAGGGAGRLDGGSRVQAVAARTPTPPSNRPPTPKIRRCPLAVGGASALFRILGITRNRTARKTKLPQPRVGVRGYGRAGVHGCADPHEAARHGREMALQHDLAAIRGAGL